MKRAVRTSIRSFSQRHEWLAGAIGAILLVSAGATSLSVLQGHYLALQQMEAKRVKHHLQLHIDEARQQLKIFLQQPASRWQQQADLLLPALPDVYLLDDQQQVRRVIKATSGSRIFAGFSFAGSPINDALASGSGRTNGFTPIIRGLEDELTSLYIWQRVAGNTVLARVQLSHIQRFLTDYSAFSGTPTLLVKDNGVVLLSGLESLSVATIDPRVSPTTRPVMQGDGAIKPMQLGERSWLPVTSEQSVLGARIVTLLPADQLMQMRQIISTACILLLLILVLIINWKHRRLCRHLFTPLAQLADQITAQEQRIRQGERPEPPAESPLRGTHSRLSELVALQASFGRLLATIRQRDQALNQARERDRRHEERQRQLLQNKLRSSLMAASIAHEINLPLATIRLLCRQASELLAANGDAMTNEHLVSALSLQSQKVSNVIERMRMLLLNIQTEHDIIDHQAVVRDACKSIQPLVHELGGQLEICCLLPEAGLVLEGDAVQLQMAVTNLLRNGIEAATERSDGKPRLRISVFTMVGELVIEVADNGPGFHFLPSDETLLQTSKASGSGLGLFVVRTTVAHHQGRLRFGRCPRLGGARVRLHLPLLKDTERATQGVIVPASAAELSSRSR